jgi:hypothetical protein
VTGIQVHVGEMLTGRITDTIPVTGMGWADTLNQPGSITSVTVPEDVVRAVKLRDRSQGMRAFLAVEVDGRIRQAGPITSRSWDWAKGEATFGAQGVWGWLDRRLIRPAVLASPMQKSVFTVSGKSLGGIARAIVERATAATYTGVPIVLPPDESGTRTESFLLRELPWAGEQLRQITQRATDAPDIAFRARRRADDPRFIEWVMLAGTEAKPYLSQGGPDWVFDTTAPRSPVLGIGTDEDPTVMAQQVWATGEGSEEDTLMSVRWDPTLLDLGWPLTEADEAYSTVNQQSTLDSHAAAALSRRARPVEVFKVSVHRSAAREVWPGDYCRVITKGDAWLGDMDRVMRVRTISGGLDDVITLEMFPMQAVL